MIKRYDAGGGRKCPKRLRRRQKCKTKTIILCNMRYNFVQVLSLPRRILFATNIDISGSHLPSCQEDCNLGEWGEWSECSQSCGQDGVQVT